MRPGETMTALRAVNTPSMRCKGVVNSVWVMPGKSGFSGCTADKLFGGRGLDLLADDAEITGFRRFQGESDAGSVDQHVGHTTPRDVDGQRADAGNLDGGVEVVDERRLIDESDAGDLAVVAGALQFDQARQAIRGSTR